MANIKNFGLSGISADVQFGKAGGRVVYDAGNSVFKVTQADGSTLDNIRVATTPLNANDAASKAYVDSKSSSDAAAVQAELDATQVGAGLGTDGGYTANGTANYISAAVSLKDADNKLDAALKVEELARIAGDSDLQDAIDAEEARALAAEGVLQGNIDSEAATRLAADGVLQDNIDSEATTRFNNDATLQSNIDSEESARIAADGVLQDNIDSEAATRLAADNALDARLDIIEGGAEVAGSIAKALADANTYTDGEISTLDSTLRSYIDTSVQAKDNTDEITEGTTNLFFTQARARASISVTDNGGDGALSYNSTTGVITYTGPSAAEVRAHFTGGKGVSITNGEVALDFTEFSTTDVVEGTNLYWTVARGESMFDTRLATKSTTDLAEGTNLYYTDARVDAYVSGGDLSAIETVGDAVIGGNLSVGGVLTVSGNGTSTFTGNVSIDGTINVAGDATFLANISGDTMTMTGDLSVTGNTVLSQLVTVESDATKAAGSNIVNVFEVVSSDAQKLFEVRQNGDAVVGGSLTVNGDSASLAGNLSTTGNATVSGDLSVGGSLTVAGDATFSANINGNNMSLSGNLIVGDADTDYVEFNADVASDFIPDVTGTYDLGTAAKSWNNVYAANVTADTVTVGTLNLTSGITGLTLDGLDDVEITSVATNQIIAWDGTKWVNIDNVNVNGSLTVAGDINAEANIILNSDVTGAPTENAIIRVERGTSADVEIKWNETTDQWEVTNDGTNYTALSITAGTGVAVSSTGVVSIGQAVETTSDVTFNDVTVSGVLNSDDITANTVTITGNLVVNGTTTTVNTETIALADNTIVLNSNATGAASQNAGIEVERGSDANVSLLWDESADRWTVGTDTFVAGAFIGNLTGNVTGNLTGDVTGTVSDISNHTTDALAEGSTNLYYTDGRVAAYLTTNAYATEAYTDAAVADKNSFVVRKAVGTSEAIGTIVNVAGHTYYVSRITVKVTSAYDATVSISDGTNTLMTAAEIEEDVVGTYVAELPFATATAGGATISLVSAATAGAATVTVEYVQL
jgi:hypothetical protein